MWDLLNKKGFQEFVIMIMEVIKYQVLKKIERSRKLMKKKIQILIN